MALDTYSETALVSMAILNGSEMQFASITETVDIDIGDKDFDVIATLSGGRLVKFNPQEPTTITLEAYPVDAGTSGASPTTGTGFFDIMNTFDTSQPLSIATDRTRAKVRIIALWTDDTTITTANEAVDSSATGLRVTAKNGYLISAKPSFTDGVLKWTISAKFPPFNKSGTANVTIESTDGTATMTAVAAYT